MRSKWLGLVFPLGVLGLMATERLSTFLIGSYPSSATLWATSIELKSVFQSSARGLDTISGGLMSLQLGVLLLFGLALLFAAGMRRGVTVSFLVNHVALIFVGAAAVMTADGTVASSNGLIATPSGLILGGSLHFQTIHYVLLAFGLLGCAVCHYNFLSQTAARQRAVALALRDLAFNLGDRRGAR